MADINVTDVDPEGDIVLVCHDNQRGQLHIRVSSAIMKLKPAFKEKLLNHEKGPDAASEQIACVDDDGMAMLTICKTLHALQSIDQPAVNLRRLFVVSKKCGVNGTMAPQAHLWIASELTELREPTHRDVPRIRDLLAAAVGFGAQVLAGKLAAQLEHLRIKGKQEILAQILRAFSSQARLRCQKSNCTVHMCLLSEFTKVLDARGLCDFDNAELSLQSIAVKVKECSDQLLYGNMVNWNNCNMRGSCLARSAKMQQIPGFLNVSNAVSTVETRLRSVTATDSKGEIIGFKEG